MQASFLAAIGLGIALAGAPGPVQGVLLAESLRGGVARGFRALAGSSATFGAILVALALGVSLAPPAGAALRALRIGGGLLLLWLAADGLRSAASAPGSDEGTPRRGLPPVSRGALAILLNPGAWLFLAVVASPLLATAARSSGRDGALLAAFGLLAGAGIGDAAIVLLGGAGVRRARAAVVTWVRRGLAIVLGILGVAAIVVGIVG